MPYRYLDDIATADVAFEAWGPTLEELFVAAAAATMNVMVEDLNTIAHREHRTIQVEADAVDMLLFEFLQELIYYKDAQRLLLRVSQVRIDRRDDHFLLQAEAYGEEIDPRKHELLVDVKAVTLHRFQVERTADGWRAMVILDI
ncbi:MAG: archease [Acidobacteria bacterium]|nr:MAG: archease [Acidobacteriota bacterium]